MITLRRMPRVNKPDSPTWRVVTGGVTRTVFLTKNYAFKVPAFHRGWRLFLHGLLANSYEAMWWRETNRDDRLCPVLFALWGGWLTVMPRCQPISREKWLGILDWPCEWEGLPVDLKVDNFGVLRDKFGIEHIVLVDYGS